MKKILEFFYMKCIPELALLTSYACIINKYWLKIMKEAIESYYQRKCPKENEIQREENRCRFLSGHSPS